MRLKLIECGKVLHAIENYEIKKLKISHGHTWDEIIKHSNCHPEQHLHYSMKGTIEKEGRRA